MEASKSPSPSIEDSREASADTVNLSASLHGVNHTQEDIVGSILAQQRVIACEVATRVGDLNLLLIRAHQSLSRYCSWVERFSETVALKYSDELTTCILHLPEPPTFDEIYLELPFDPSGVTEHFKLVLSTYESAANRHLLPPMRKHQDSLVEFTIWLQNCFKMWLNYDATGVVNALSHASKDEIFSILSLLECILSDQEKMLRKYCQLLHITQLDWEGTFASLTREFPAPDRTETEIRKLVEKAFERDGSLLDNSHFRDTMKTLFGSVISRGISNYTPIREQLHELIGKEEFAPFKSSTRPTFIAAVGLTPNLASFTANVMYHPLVARYSKCTEDEEEAGSVTEPIKQTLRETYFEKGRPALKGGNRSGMEIDNADKTQPDTNWKPSEPGPSSTVDITAQPAEAATKIFQQWRFGRATSLDKGTRVVLDSYLIKNYGNTLSKKNFACLEVACDAVPTEFIDRCSTACWQVFLCEARKVR